ncbi:prepilin peptidase [bacterium]|nr:prepilin peptidase [bacterium]
MDKFIQSHIPLVIGVMMAVGAFAGVSVGFWSLRLCEKFDESANFTELPDRRLHVVPHLLAGMLVFAAYAGAAFLGEGLSVTEVRPDAISIYLRAAGHLILLTLLLAATSTDLRDYIIPDQITLPGTAFGLLLATVSGDTQIMHLWVDWNDPLAGIAGPAIPGWIAEHRYLHGFAWSVCGLAAGGGITLLVQRLSALILGQEALGLGDVTLMMLIGSFLGWQAVLIVFLLSPLCGLAFGLTVRFTTNKSYVPYGPYLAMGALLTLLGWRWLWTLELAHVFSVCRLFGDPTGLAMLAGIALAGFIVLLGGVRLFRAIPGRKR